MLRMGIVIIIGCLMVMNSYMCMWEVPLDYTFSNKKLRARMSCARLPKELPRGLDEKDYLPTDAIGHYTKVLAKNKKEAIVEAEKRLVKYTKGEYAEWFKK